MNSHLIIPDTQVKEGVPLDHFYALGNLIRMHTPDVIIHLGDHWDMPSLSSYDEGKAAMENRRYWEDVMAGNDAMDIIIEAIDSIPNYEPRLVFCIGNHEHRITRYVEDNPKLEDTVTLDDLNLDRWEVYGFQEMVVVDGVCYSHMFVNPFSGSAIGGTMQNRINKLKFSFTQGHIQKFDYGKEYLNNGQIINGMVAGAFYMHDEEYKGPQGNNHFRGIIYKTNVHDGDYDFEMVRLETLIEGYGE